MEARSAGSRVRGLPPFARRSCSVSCTFWSCAARSSMCACDTGSDFASLHRPNSAFSKSERSERRENVQERVSVFMTVSQPAAEPTEYSASARHGAWLYKSPGKTIQEHTSFLEGAMRKIGACALSQRVQVKHAAVSLCIQSSLRSLRSWRAGTVRARSSTS